MSLFLIRDDGYGRDEAAAGNPFSAGEVCASVPRSRRLSQLQHLSETIYIFPQEPPTKEPTLSFHLSVLPSCSHSSILPALMWFPRIWNQRKRRVGFSSTLCSEDAAAVAPQTKEDFFFFLFGIGFHWDPTVFFRLHDFNPRFPKSRGVYPTRPSGREPQGKRLEWRVGPEPFVYLSQAH